MLADGPSLDNGIFHNPFSFSVYSNFQRALLLITQAREKTLTLNGPLISLSYCFHWVQPQSIRNRHKVRIWNSHALKN